MTSSEQPGMSSGGTGYQDILQKIGSTVLTPQGKQDILDDYSQKHKDLGRRQREYKKILSARLKTRGQRILEKSYVKTIKSLRNERNELRAQIWVANGKSHDLINSNYLRLVKCHVSCQERLTSDIEKLKVVICKLERELGRIDKQIYDLNRRTVPDSQHQDYVARARKKLSILENRLEMGIRRECGFTALNASLREEIKSLLDHRGLFNNSYTKLIQMLNSDGKYLTDLIEFASNTFENCINAHEKLNNAVSKHAKEAEHIRVEMQGVIRKRVSTDGANLFSISKAQVRAVDELQPKEIKRRKLFVHDHTRKIELYTKVIDRLLFFTNTHNVSAVIEMFQQQESLYYSYFSYANETSFHITLLNSAVNRLYTEVSQLRQNNVDGYTQQANRNSELWALLEAKRKKNNELKATSDASEARLKKLLLNLTSIFNTCNANPRAMLRMPGDNSFINVFNVRGFLKILENRVTNIVKNVYIMERANDYQMQTNYVVKEIEKIKDFVTDLDDIVLTQQCPECAEGEAFNMDDANENAVVVHTIEETKSKLVEKVNQPEMQYRLHSISQCRLPRSRILAAKRNN